MVLLYDKVPISSRRINDKGFLEVDAVFSRVGIQRYTAKELGLQDRPAHAILRVYRPPEEVSSPESLASFENIPVTDDHPPENVTAKNFRKYAVGNAGARTFQDGVTKGKLLIQDADVISKVDRGKVEISDGYSATIEVVSGTTPEGEQYDAIKRNIRGNHTAIVDFGRCGGACRIQDGAICEECAAGQQGSCGCQGGTEVTTPNTGSQLVQRVVDGITISVTDQGAQVIDKLQQQLTDAKTALTDASNKLTTQQTDHQKAIEAKDGEIAGLKAQVTDAALDARATARANLIDSVRSICGKEYDAKGKTNLQMMQDAVTKVHGAQIIDGKSEEFVSAIFSTLKPGERTSSTDDFRQDVRDHGLQERREDIQDRGAPKGRDAYLARLRAGPQLQQKAR